MPSNIYIMREIKIKNNDKISILAGLLIDGTGNPPQENAVVAIEKSVIQSISRAPLGSTAEAGPLPVGFARSCDPAGHAGCPSMVDPAQSDCSGKIYDLSGYTLLPGLIDCHVHLALDGRDFARSLNRWDDPAAVFKSVRNLLADTLAAGVVAVRDGGDRRMLAFRCRAEKQSGTGLPRVVACGMALRKTGGYGSFLGRGMAPGDIPAAVAGLASQGIDQVKVLASGIVSFKQYGHVGHLQFEQGELNLICAAARSHGLKVMAHASSDDAVRAAVLAGAGSIEHGYFVSKETLYLMAERGTAWVPTFTPVASRLDGEMRLSHSPEEIAVIERTFRLHQEMVAYAHGLGVPVGVGTDSGASGVRHGLSYTSELKLLLDAGLPCEQVIQLATGKSAAITGTAPVFGSMAPGRPICAVAIRGNILKNISLLRKPSFLFNHI